MTLEQENERLRGLLYLVAKRVRNGSAVDRIILERIDAALSQQAEPSPTVNALSFVQPVPDHCDRIVWRERYYHLPLYTESEPAPARDEREAFEASFKTLEAGLSLDGIYALHMAKEIYWQGWQARSTRPAQTEQQPIRMPCRMWESQHAESPEYASGYNTALDHVARLNATHIAQTALSAVTAERDRLREQVAEMAAGTIDPADLCEIERDQLRAEAERLREAESLLLSVCDDLMRHENADVRMVTCIELNNWLTKRAAMTAKEA